MAETKMTVIDEVCKSIERMEGEYKKALPPQIVSGKFIRTTITYLKMNPKLLGDGVDKPSLYAAIQQAAQDGLLIDGRDGALVPFKGKVRFMPMVGGICKRARNSGDIKSIGAQVVYQNDTYDAWEDENGPHFKFRRAMSERGKVLCTFAYAVTKDGGVYFEEIGEEEMDKIRKMARADDTPWKGPFEDEMRKKSALRRLLKYRVPSSADLDEIIRQDDTIYELPKDQPPPERKAAQTTSSRLRNVVDTQAEPTPAETDAELAVAAGEEDPL